MGSRSDPDAASLGHRHWEIVGWHEAYVGRPREALASCQRALILYQQLGDRRGEADAWDSLGLAHHHLGHPARAVLLPAGPGGVRALGDRCQAETMVGLGEALQATAAPDRAGEAWRDALSILTELRLPAAERVRRMLHDLGRAAADPIAS